MFSPQSSIKCKFQLWLRAVWLYCCQQRLSCSSLHRPTLAAGWWVGWIHWSKWKWPVEQKCFELGSSVSNKNSAGEIVRKCCWEEGTASHQFKPTLIIRLFSFHVLKTMNKQWLGVKNQKQTIINFRINLCKFCLIYVSPFPFLHTFYLCMWSSHCLEGNFLRKPRILGKVC